MANEIHLIKHTQAENSYGIIVDGHPGANRYFLRMDEMRDHLLEVQTSHPDYTVVNGYAKPTLSGQVKAGNTLDAEALGKLLAEPEKEVDSLEQIL